MKKFYLKLFVVIGLLTTTLSYGQSVIVDDILPGSDGSYPDYLKVVGNRLFFFYDEPTMDYYEAPGYINQQNEIVKLKWPAGLRSDGDDSFYDLNGEPIWLQDVYDSIVDDYYSMVCIERNDSIVFLTDYNDGYYTGELFVYNNKAYFPYYVDSIGYELFAYDGTSIALVEDLNPGTSDSYPYHFFNHDGDLYFNADMPSVSGALVKYDGTTFTTYNTPQIYSNTYNYKTSIGSDLYYWNSSWPPSIVKFNNGPQDTIPSQVSGNTCYAGFLTSSGGQLYVMGSVLGQSKMIKYNTTTNEFDDILPNLNNIYYAVNYHDTLFFSAHDINASTSGLFYLIPGVDTAVNVVNYNVYDIEVNNNKLYFSLNDGNIGYEPYKWNNGTVQLIADVNSNWSSNPYYYTEFNGQLAISAETDNQGREIVFVCMTPVAAPTAPLTQIACEGSEVADLDITGTNLTFFTSATGSTMINPTTTLTQDGSVFAVSNQVCPSARIEVPFTVSMLPDPAASHYGNGYITVITPSATYQWLDCSTGDTIAGATNQSYQANGNGSYQCIVTNADGCSAVSDCIYVVNLSVEENLKNNVFVYPNPAKDVLSIQADELIKSTELMSLSGQLVQSNEVNALNQTMDLTNLSTGIYFLSVYNQQGTCISKQKVVINK